MNARTVTCAILVGLGWACATVHGQDMAPAPGVQPPPIQPTPTAATNNQANAAATAATLNDQVLLPGMLPPGPPVPPGTSGLSDWILYRRPGSGCCDPGPLMPLYAEAYLRVGPTVPVGGNYLGRELLVGWALEGGVRALFFNRPDSAWTLDLGVVNFNNGALSPGTPKTLSLIEPNAVTGTPTRFFIPVTMKNFNVTMASLGLGKEYYIFAPREGWAGRWRIGWDGGGRYGASSMTFNEIRHRTDTCEGMYIAAHTDYEIPCGCCYLAFGLRGEWSYTWDNILQGQTNIQQITGLVTFSVRY